MATTEIIKDSSLPSYSQLLSDLYKTCEYNWKGFNWDINTYPLIFKEDVLRFAYVSISEVSIVVFFAILFTLCRYVLTFAVYRVSSSNVIKYY